MSYFTNTTVRASMSARVNDLYIDGQIYPALPINPNALVNSINLSVIDPNTLLSIYGLTQNFGDDTKPRLLVGNGQAGDGFFYGQDNNQEFKVNNGGDETVNLRSLNESFSLDALTQAGANYTLQAAIDCNIYTTAENGTINIENRAAASDIYMTATNNLSMEAPGEIAITNSKQDGAIGLNVQLQGSQFQMQQTEYRIDTIDPNNIAETNIRELLTNDATFKRDFIYNPFNLNLLRGTFTTSAGTDVFAGTLTNPFNPDAPIEFKDDEFTSYSALQLNTTSATLQCKGPGGTSTFEVLSDKFRMNLTHNPVPVTPQGVFIDANNYLWKTNANAFISLDPVGVGAHFIENNTGVFTHKALTSADSSVTITDSADTIDLSVSVSAPNFYDIDGTLTSSRTVNGGGNSLQYTNINGYSVTSTNNLILTGNGVSTISANTTNVGSTGGTCVVQSGIVSMPQLPSATKANILYYDSATKYLSYGAAPASGMTPSYASAVYTNQSCGSITSPPVTLNITASLLTAALGPANTGDWGLNPSQGYGLKFNGSSARAYKISLSCNYTCSVGTSKTVSIGLFQNSTVITGSTDQFIVSGSASTLNGSAFDSIIVVNPGDVISPALSSSVITDINNLNANLSVIALS